MKTFEEIKASLLAGNIGDETPEFRISLELINARLIAGMSQAKMAECMGTSQSHIGRLESGIRLPTMRTLVRWATATGCRLIVKMEPIAD